MDVVINVKAHVVQTAHQSVTTSAVRLATQPVSLVVLETAYLNVQQTALLIAEQPVKRHVSKSAITAVRRNANRHAKMLAKKGVSLSATPAVTVVKELVHTLVKIHAQTHVYLDVRMPAMAAMEII